MKTVIKMLVSKPLRGGDNRSVGQQSGAQFCFLLGMKKNLSALDPLTDLWLHVVSPQSVFAFSLFIPR